MRNTQENWVTPRNCGNLKYHLQLKTEENVGGGESAMGGYQENTVNKCKFVKQTKVSALSIDEFLGI